MKRSIGFFSFRLLIGLGMVTVLFNSCGKDKDEQTTVDPCETEKSALVDANANLNNQLNVIDDLFNKCMDDAPGFRRNYENFLEAGITQEQAIENTINNLLGNLSYPADARKLLEDYTAAVEAKSAFEAAQQLAQQNADKCAAENTGK